jgi:hypothetical protein
MRSLSVPVGPVPEASGGVDQYDPELRAHIEAAMARAQARLADAPALARETEAWMLSLTDGAPPATYFTHRAAFPMLLLPWWLEGSLTASRDPDFDADLVSSTIDGYYVVRMIDDLMDGDRPPMPGAIPSLIPFQAGFLFGYQRWFPPGDPFWAALLDGALTSAEMAAADAGLAMVDRERFLAVSGRKVTGAKLPILAICHRYGRLDLIDPWSSFIDCLGRWHQMSNDISGWSRDLAHGRATYFLSEAAGRGGGGAASVAEWVLTVGLAWGSTQLDGWMTECVEAAEALDCPALLAYLDDRRRAAAAEFAALESSLAAVRHVADAFAAARSPGA